MVDISKILLALSLHSCLCSVPNFMVELSALLLFGKSSVLITAIMIFRFNSLKASSPSLACIIVYSYFMCTWSTIQHCLRNRRAGVGGWPLNSCQEALIGGRGCRLRVPVQILPIMLRDCGFDCWTKSNEITVLLLQPHLQQSTIKNIGFEHQVIMWYYRIRIAQENKHKQWNKMVKFITVWLYIYLTSFQKDNQFTLGINSFFSLSKTTSVFHLGVWVCWRNGDNYHTVLRIPLSLSLFSFCLEGLAFVYRKNIKSKKLYSLLNFSLIFLPLFENLTCNMTA